MVPEPLSDAGEFGFMKAFPAFSLVDQYSVINFDDINDLLQMTFFLSPVAV